MTSRAMNLEARFTLRYTPNDLQHLVLSINLDTAFSEQKVTMRFLKTTLIITACLIFVVGCQRATDNRQTTSNTVPEPSPRASIAAPSPIDEFATVRPIFAESCAKCHHEDGAGGLYEEDGRSLRVPSLREGRAVSHTDARYVRQITNGGDGMPAFGDRLSPQQIDELVRFVRRTFQNQQ